MLAVARYNLVFQHLNEYDGEDSYANQTNGAESSEKVLGLRNKRVVMKIKIVKSWIAPSPESVRSKEEHGE